MSSRSINHSCQPPSLADGSHLENAQNIIRTALNTAIQRIRKHGYQSRSRSVYIGLSGIAMLEHRLSKNAGIWPSKELSLVGDQALLDFLKSLSSWEGHPTTPSRTSFLETDVGVATLLLLYVLETVGPTLDSSLFSDHVYPALQAITAALETVTDSENDTCEILYGRAGLLYALLRIRGELRRVRTLKLSCDDQNILGICDTLERLASNQSLQPVVDSIIEIGRDGARQYARQLVAADQGPNSPQLMWSWHCKRYLGAAHGVLWTAGILFVLWNCPFEVVKPYAADLTQTLEWLVNIQDPLGNWPTKAPDDVHMVEARENELVQWCHGASGILILLSKASRQQNDIVLDEKMRQKVNTAMIKAARVVYRNGLLRKGIGICHGVAGSVYGMLAVSQVFDDHHVSGSINNENSKYLRQALHLALLAVEYEKLEKNGNMKAPDRPWSLYEGVAGMCCAWLDVLCSLSGHRVGGIPGFDDI